MRLRRATGVRELLVMRCVLSGPRWRPAVAASRGERVEGEVVCFAARRFSSN